MSFRIVENLTPDESQIDIIRLPLRQYNEARIGIYQTQSLLLTVFDENQFIGGAYSFIKLGWLNIDLLWVDAHYRKQGIGGSLLKKMETYAKSNNIFHAKLNTGNFQGSVEFYENQGYKIFAELEIFPENKNSDEKCIDFYMKKSLEQGYRT